MFGLIIGMFVGYFGSLVMRSRKFKETGVQTCEVPLINTVPILIPNSKKIFIPELKNFWGPDS